MTDFFIGQRFLQAHRAARDVVFRFIGGDATHRYTRGEIFQRRVDVGTGAAFCLAPAELAVLAGNKYAGAVERLHSEGMDFGAPRQQVIHGHLILGRVGADSGLDNGHAHLFDGVTVQGPVPCKGTEGVKPHLRIAHGIHTDTLAVFVIKNVQRVIADHHAITSTETIRHDIRKVHLLLRHNRRRIGVAQRLFHNPVAVNLGTGQHFGLIELVPLQRAQLLSHRVHIAASFDEQFTNAMRQCTLLGIDARTDRKLRLKRGRRGTDQIAVRIGRAALGMNLRACHLLSPFLAVDKKREEHFSPRESHPYTPRRVFRGVGCSGPYELATPAWRHIPTPSSQHP